ncbi:MAG: crosslink repair DNA glycosylase YcaQ family protein [Pseudobdellovibrio sp.]
MLPKITKEIAKNIWIHAQRLDSKNSFGTGETAVAKAISHLGYVQIDTINVIERCHHHILYNRIPNYQTRFLHAAQTKEKTIFEYWTHALSYVHVDDFKYFVRKMNSVNATSNSWFNSVKESDYAKVKALLKKEGHLSIRDIKDDILIEKTHAWGSTKPSKKALQLGFYKGDFAIAERDGIIKKYALTKKHFNWNSKPKATTKNEYANYILQRALKSQGIISLESACYLEKEMKKSISELIQEKIKTHELIEIELIQAKNCKFYINPEIFEKKIKPSQLTHILSPFDPLLIQRKKLKIFFDYEHLFEAYIPKEKRIYGYFTLPVLKHNKIIALLDLKTDRAQKQLLIQSWTWLNKNKSAENKKIIECELALFEKFQLNL